MGSGAGPPALAGRAAPSSHIGATRFGQEIPRLRQAGEHRIDVGSQDLRDLRVTHAGENREKQDLAMVERERIEPQDVLRQKRKRRVRSSWVHNGGPLSLPQSVEPDQRSETPGDQRRTSLRAVGPHRQDDGLLHEVVGGLSTMTTNESAREPPQVRHELSDIISAARHSVDFRDQGYEVLTNLAQSGVKAHGVGAPFSKF